MEYFDKKLTYLRGLCDGSGFDPDTKEGKIFHNIIDILEDMAFMLETFLDDDDDFENIPVEYESDEEPTDREEEPVYLYSFICTNCGEEIEVDEEMIQNLETIQCPVCGNDILVGAVDIEDLKF